MAGNEPSLILILGGARSGKSTYAEALARKLGQRVLYVATAEVLDDEMRTRAEVHRARRPPHWKTLEAPLNVGATLRNLPEAAAVDVVLLDCLTLLVSNSILVGGPDAPEPDVATAWAGIQHELGALLAAHRSLGAHLIVVSNEVGLGVVPAYSLGRIYRDCLGQANQWLAKAADSVILMVAALPVDLRQLPLVSLE